MSGEDELSNVRAELCYVHLFVVWDVDTQPETKRKRKDMRKERKRMRKMKRETKEGKKLDGEKEANEKKKCKKEEEYESEYEKHNYIPKIKEHRVVKSPVLPPLPSTSFLPIPLIFPYLFSLSILLSHLDLR